MNNEFFPQADYKIPNTSNYMKFAEGENPFRVLSSAITGWEYWNTDSKPIRSDEEFDGVPDDIKTEKNGSVKIVHFWAFVVYNYNAKRIQILELTQKGIMRDMQAYLNNPKWGKPFDYDFIVHRSGSGLDTEYSLSVNPKAPLDEDILAKYTSTSINLKSLFSGDDPFRK